MLAAAAGIAAVLGGCATQQAGAKYVSVSAGSSHTCAIDENGNAWCWGGNRFGQLGDGSTDASVSPRQVAGGNRWRQIAAGNSHTCGVTGDGTVWCWGGNFAGKLGNGSTDSSPVPVKVEGLPGPVRFVAVSSERSCAAPESGGVWCWGDNTHDVTGIDSGGILPTARLIVDGEVRSIAISPARGCYALDEVLCSGIDVDGESSTTFSGKRIEGLPGDIVELTAAQFMICSRSGQGRVHCWGSVSWSGTIAEGNLRESLWTPATEIPEADAAAIAHMDSTICILDTDGRVTCLGYRPGTNWLLDGGFATPPALSTNRLGEKWELVLSAEDIVALDGGVAHICGVDAAGDIWCIGQNTDGQLGDGSRTERDRAVRVPRAPS
jgi:alpha-tubulin suppressor-like RCC1 family protein